MIIIDLLLGVAGQEEEISAIHYYMINLNHWRFDRIISSKKSETLYSENTFPLLVVLNSWIAKLFLHLGYPYFVSVLAPFFVNLVFFLFWVDDQKVIKFFDEKAEVVADKFDVIDMKNPKFSNEKVSSGTTVSKNYKILLFFGFSLMGILLKDCYQENSTFQKWRVNFLGFFMVFPIFLKFNCKLSDCNLVFLLNFLFFFLDYRNIHVNLLIFLVNFMLIFYFRKKILCFCFGYLLLNLDVFVSYFIEKEMPIDVKFNIFAWKLFIFAQIFIFFFLIIRPKKKLQKYASFIKEMYFYSN